MSEDRWMPRPWHEEFHGCLWLPRLLDKGRRAIESEKVGRDLLDGYLYGDSDFVDAKLMQFLRTKDARVTELLREFDDDERVAKVIIQESGRTADELRAWSARFRKVHALVIPLLESDEGRRQPGAGTAFFRFFYNYILMPPVYLAFRISERRRGRSA